MSRFRRKINRRRQKARRLSAEPLERRDMLSISMVGDEVHVLGTSGNDHAEVRWIELDGSDIAGQWARQYVDGYYRVELNGRSESFLELVDGPISKIVFRGYDGDDSFINHTYLPSDAYGGRGRDTLQGGRGPDLLVGGADLDHLYGGRGADELYARELPLPPGTCMGAVDERLLVGTPDHDEVHDAMVAAEPTCSSSGGEITCVDLLGGETSALVHDYLYGEQGDDVLHGGQYNDRMWGGDGNDTLFGNEGDDRLFGGEGQDAIEGGTGDDLLAGEGGRDTLRGGAGNDRLFGGDRTDVLFGESGDDVLLGESGFDILFGGPDNDHLLGGEDADTLYGGEGNDGLFGGADDVADELWGDDLAGTWGADRFLTRALDTVHDVRSRDVEIGFPDESDERAWTSGTTPWTDREVYWVDAGMARLQEHAETTMVLKDTFGNGPIEFVKTFQSQNVEWESDEGWRTLILIEDWHEEQWLGNDLWFGEDIVPGTHSSNPTTRTPWITIHELAHNWGRSSDTDIVASHPAGVEYWPAFEDLYYSSDFSSESTDFARDYGRTGSPVQEDWATCWEYHFGLRTASNPESPSAILQAKLAIVDEFFAEFRSWREYTLETDLAQLLKDLTTQPMHSTSSELPRKGFLLSDDRDLCASSQPAWAVAPPHRLPLGFMLVC